MADPKPLVEWIIESIDEELAKRAGLTGREIYHRGVERYEQAYQIRSMAERLRGLRRDKGATGTAGDGI